MTDTPEQTVGHTTGPWSFECGDHSHRYVHVTDADDRTVHYKYACAGPHEGARDEANARLIAAAPCLLGAMKEGRETLIGADLQIRAMPGMDQRHVEFIRLTLTKIDAAIAQATGAKP